MAAERGAIGCLIDSDPHEDGYFAGDVYPKGGYRSAGGAQRGSVADMPLYPGDPLTPGVGATKDAERLPLDKVATLTKIPVLPISYGDARPLLEALAGPVAPESWRGSLPITYHLGPGPAKVRLSLAFDWKRVVRKEYGTTFSWTTTALALLALERVRWDGVREATPALRVLGATWLSIALCWATAALAVITACRGDRPR